MKVEQKGALCRLCVCAGVALWCGLSANAFAGTGGPGLSNEVPTVVTSNVEFRGAALADLYFEGFEAYDCASLVVGQGGWASWDNTATAGDEAFVACDPAPVFMGDKSMGVPGNGLADADSEDIVYEYDDLLIDEGDVVRYRAWLHIPSTVTGSPYFILLNTYNVGGDKNWSMQLEMNATDNYVDSEFECDRPTDTGCGLDLIEDAWVEVTVLIDLIQNQQTIKYNDDLLSSKSWSEGVSGGGALFLDALDIWSNDAALGTVFYDDIRIEEVDPIGAGCNADDTGSCTEATNPSDCTLPDCYFQGFGTLCADVECPTLGADGWRVVSDDFPFQFDGDTTTEDDTCGYSTTPDIQFTLDIDHDGRYLMNACAAEWDNYLALGSSPCDADVAENDDSEVCGGLQARITADLEDLGDAVDYYLTLGSTFDEQGPFGLLVREICIQTIADRSAEATIREDLSEPCGDDTNGGCNMDVPAYQPAVCGDLVWGTFWYDGATRDTDWFEIDLDAGTPMCLTGDAEAGFLIGKVQDSETQDCEVTQFIAPNDDVLPCLGKTAEVDFTQETTDTIWLFAASNFDDLNDCAEFDNYWMEISCTGCGGAPCDGDANDDGTVDTGDLIILLASWGPDGGGGPADFNDDATVDTADLIILLAAWGPCP